MLRQRHHTKPVSPEVSPSSASTSVDPAIEEKAVQEPRRETTEKMGPSSERRPLLQGEGEEDTVIPPQAWSLRNQWILLAIASGACAAFNGVFAKL
jgi:hypothetical protein